MVLAACGGSGSSSGNDVNATQKTAATVTGVVSFPVLSALVAKQAAAAATVIPPVLTITDLSGAVIATPTLTVDSVDPKKFTYTASLDASKNYVFKASWGGQVLRGLADQSTLSTLTTVINVTPVSTAAVLMAEQKLNLAAGQLGTTAAGAVTAAQLGAVNPAALLSAIENGKSTTYAPLVSAVTAALTGFEDPARVTAVTAAVSTAPAYSAPQSFTLAMISGKTFKDDSGVTITLNSNGTVTTSKNQNTNFWILNPDGTILISYTDLTTNTTGWDRITLVQVNSTVSLVISDLNINGTTYPNSTWTYYVPTSTGTVVGTYSITVSGSGNPVTATITVSANGTITGTDSQGASITGNANPQTGAFTASVAATPTNGNASVSLIGTINLSTGAMTGTFSVSGRPTETGTFSGTRTNTGTNTQRWYWSGNTLYGQSGNGSATVPGTDIKSVTFSSDANYLYWAMELYGTPNTNLSTSGSTIPGYDVTITKTDGTIIDSRVAYQNGVWNSLVATKAPGGQFSGLMPVSATTAINGKIPLSLLGTGDIKTFPQVRASVYLGGNSGTMGIGN
jgi:hypothetical protein